MKISIDKELKAVQKDVLDGKVVVHQDLSWMESQKLTVEKLKAALPKGSQVHVTQTLVEAVNDTIAKSGCHKELMEERLLTYMHLLGPGIGLKQLLNAIQFVTLCATPGVTQQTAYMITFPDKAQELLEQNRDMSSFASQYAKSSLVVTITANTQIGFHISHAPLRNAALQKLVDLSNGKAANGQPCSPTVQLNATLGILEAVALPMEQTINLKTAADEREIAATQNLADQIEKMAKMQLLRLQKGESLNSVQKVGIITDAELEDS